MEGINLSPPQHIIFIIGGYNQLLTFSEKYNQTINNAAILKSNEPWSGLF